MTFYVFISAIQPNGKEINSCKKEADDRCVVLVCWVCNCVVCASGYPLRIVYVCLLCVFGLCVCIVYMNVCVVCALSVCVCIVYMNVCVVCALSV